MDAPHFKRMEDLYNAALARSPSERDRFLHEACTGDESLLHEVRSLLGLEEEARGILEEPVAEAITRKLSDLRGTRLGPYEISDRIGAGGMGEVYRAHDTRLDREVAIKVLHVAAAGDTDPLRRFEREARSAAALNHPNVATIYEIGDHDGMRFLAMELVEGRTLERLIEAGPLSVQELLQLATQIARGLAKAHGAGIVHRDLKPGNLMVTSDGLVKILDFGLAKRTPHPSDVSSGITREGSVLGTVQYMSPEQAAARPLDHRSDQFSFGAILYEMATGRRPFEKGTTPQTLAAIIEDEPESVTRLNAAIPVELAAIVDRCLAKDPEQRYHSTADLAAELSLASAVAASVRIRRPNRWRRVAGLVGLAVVLALVVFRYVSRPRAPDLADVTLEGLPLTTYPGYEAQPTFSPDGSHVVFSWDGGARDNMDIYVKALGSEQPLRLTSDPARDGSPAWSPDGTEIAFLRDAPGGGSEVRLIPPTGGPERRIAAVQAQAHHGLAWTPDGRSLAVVDRSAPGEPLGLFMLDTANGIKKRLTSPRSPDWDMLPTVSPDGRTVAFKRSPLTRVLLVPAVGGEPRELVEAGMVWGRMAWAPGGEDVIFAAIPLAKKYGQARPSAAGGTGASLWRVSVASGRVHPLGGSVGAMDVAVSKGGHRLAYSQETTDWDIWRIALRRRGSPGEAQSRFITSSKFDGNPQFSPDGERVAFTSARSGSNEVWVADSQGGDLLRLTSLGKDGYVGAPRWSPDGESIAFDFAAEGDSNVDLYVVSASGGPPQRVTSASARDVMPSWSRDGRWIYFGSHRSGQWQVWKVPSTGEEEGDARQVTRQGGFAPIESPDGKHVYFTRRWSSTADPQNGLWRVPVEGGDEEVVVEVFYSSSGSWDVTAEGIYFVDNRPSSSGVQWVVRFLGFDRRHASEVARLPYPPFLGGPAVSVSSDGRWILSTQSQGGSDLMLVENFR